MSLSAYPDHLFRRQVDAFIRELPGVEEGAVEALHRVRVASRRLRELLPLLGLDYDTAQTLNRQLRRVTKRLGVVRELDVLMLLIDELQREGRFPETALEQVGREASHARAAARRRLAELLPAASLERLAQKLERVTSHFEVEDAEPDTTSGSPNRAARWALDGRLARRAARLQFAIRTTGTLFAPEQLHRVRIALKKLRYAAELSEGAKCHRTTDISGLKAAQDLLGRLHDLGTLVAWGRELPASLSPIDLIHWRELGGLVQAIEEDCRRLHARYLRDRTKLNDIASRLGGSSTDAAATGRRAVGKQSTMASVRPFAPGSSLTRGAQGELPLFSRALSGALSGSAPPISSVRRSR